MIAAPTAVAENHRSEPEPGAFDLNYRVTIDMHAMCLAATATASVVEVEHEVVEVEHESAADVNESTETGAGLFTVGNVSHSRV